MSIENLQYLTADIQKYILDFLHAYEFEAIMDEINIDTQYIAYRCASESVILKSNDMLLPITTIDYNLIDLPIQLLFNYIAECEYFCVGGGYPTKLVFNNCIFFNKTKAWESGDIDIYILGGKENYNTNIFNKLSNFINRHFIISSVYSNSRDDSIINILTEQIKYPIQIIFTMAKSLCEILTQYDNNYNRCGMYGGKFYIGQDVLYTLRTGIALFYRPATHLRYNKAHNYGFTIFGSNSEKDYELAQEGPEQGTYRSINLDKFKPVYLSEWFNDYCSILNEDINVKKINIDELIDKQIYFRLFSKQGFYQKFHFKIQVPTNIKYLSISLWCLPLININDDDKLETIQARMNPVKPFDISNGGYKCYLRPGTVLNPGAYNCRFRFTDERNTKCQWEIYKPYENFEYCWV